MVKLDILKGIKVYPCPHDFKWGVLPFDFCLAQIQVFYVWTYCRALALIKLEEVKK
jgi:hypothetical protein